MEKFCWKLLLFREFKKSDLFFKGQTIYWPYLRNGRSDSREKNRRCISWILDVVCSLDLWTSPITLTLGFSRSNLKIVVSPELLLSLMWNEKKEANHLDIWPCPLTIPRTLTLKFQVQSLKQTYFRNGRACWHRMKGMGLDHSWQWAWLLWDHGGVLNVPDSDFRCCHAVNMPSFRSIVFKLII